ncbi:MAG: hypothetical protein QOJ84_1811 [Bradyrhizobium sp.]|jgi:amino acid transporter|nr:hypothetical protein [Bradyrhizobium sp.]
MQWMTSTYHIFYDNAYAIILTIATVALLKKYGRGYIVGAAVNPIHIGLCCLGFLAAAALEFSTPKVDLLELMAVAFGFGAILYAMITYLLTWRYARWLTLKRGEKWIKEIDYVYLSLAAIGVSVTISKLPNVKQKLELAESIGPLFLIAAIVFRLIKTRAEIAGWNKLPEPPKEDA